MLFGLGGCHYDSEHGLCAGCMCGSYGDGVNPCYSPELTCASLGLEDGSDEYHCVSAFGGDEIPKYLAVVITGDAVDLPCCRGPATWEEDCRNERLLGGNWLNGVYVMPLRNSSASGDSWTGDGYGPVVRGWNRHCDGGEIFLANYPGYTTDQFYKKYGELPDMTVSHSLQSHFGEGYFYSGIRYAPGSGVWSWPTGTDPLGTPPGYNPPDDDGSLPCEWHTVGVKSGIYGEPSFFDPTECGEEYTFGGVTHEFNRHVAGSSAMVLIPFNPPYAHSCCQHGDICDSDYTAETDPNATGTCCIEAAFNGLKLPETVAAYFGGIENFPDRDVKAWYRHVSPDYWRADNPYGSLGPFPTDLTITAEVKQDENCVNCNETEANNYYTEIAARLTGTDVIYTEYGPVVRHVEFASTTVITKWSLGLSGGTAIHKLAPPDYELLEPLEFDAGASYNLDLGRSLDFTNSTVTLSAPSLDGGGWVSWGNCFLSEHAAAFDDVDYWELKFTPSDPPRDMLVIDADQYALTASSFLWWRNNLRETDGNGWAFNDRGLHGGAGPTVTIFSLDDDDDVPVGCVKVSLKKTRADMIETVKNAINAQGDSYIRAWSPDDKDALDTATQVTSYPSSVSFAADGTASVMQTVESIAIEPNSILLTNYNEDNDVLYCIGRIWASAPWHHAAATKISVSGDVVSASQALAEESTITLDDGQHDPVVFEFDSWGDGVAAGHVAAAIGKTNVETMANLVAAINGVDDPDTLLITAQASEPPDTRCTLWQDGEQVGAIRLPADWFTRNAETGEVTVRFDQIGQPGRAWFSSLYPVGVSVSHGEGANVYTVKLLHDNIYSTSGNRFSFALPGGWPDEAGRTGFALSCTINDAAENAGMKNGTDFSLTPHWRT